MIALYFICVNQIKCFFFRRETRHFTYFFFYWLCYCTAAAAWFHTPTYSCIKVLSYHKRRKLILANSSDIISPLFSHSLLLYCLVLVDVKQRQWKEKHLTKVEKRYRKIINISRGMEDTHGHGKAPNCLEWVSNSTCWKRSLCRLSSFIHTDIRRFLVFPPLCWVTMLMDACPRVLFSHFRCLPFENDQKFSVFMWNIHFLGIWFL